LHFQDAVNQQENNICVRGTSDTIDSTVQSNKTMLIKKRKK